MSTQPTDVTEATPLKLRRQLPCRADLPLPHPRARQPQKRSATLDSHRCERQGEGKRLRALGADRSGDHQRQGTERVDAKLNRRIRAAQL